MDANKKQHGGSDELASVLRSLRYGSGPGATARLYVAEYHGDVARSTRIAVATPSRSTDLFIQQTFACWGYNSLKLCGHGEETSGNERCDQVLLIVDHALLLDAFLAGLRELRRSGSQDLRILVIGKSALDMNRYMALLDSGIRGYLALLGEMHFLPKAIDEISSGGLWFSRAVLSAAILNPATPMRDVRTHEQRVTESRLTRQERIIADCVSNGLANREIASKLSISIKTVKLHLTHIYEKLAVSNRVQLSLLLWGDHGNSTRHHTVRRETRRPNEALAQNESIRDS